MGQRSQTGHIQGVGIRDGAPISGNQRWRVQGPAKRAASLVQVTAISQILKMPIICLVLVMGFRHEDEEREMTDALSGGTVSLGEETDPSQRQTQLCAVSLHLTLSIGSVTSSKTT